MFISFRLHSLRSAPTTCHAAAASLPAAKASQLRRERSVAKTITDRCKPFFLKQRAEELLLLKLRGQEGVQGMGGGFGSRVFSPVRASAIATHLTSSLMTSAAHFSAAPTVGSALSAGLDSPETRSAPLCGVLWVRPPPMLIVLVSLKGARCCARRGNWKPSF